MKRVIQHCVDSRVRFGFDSYLTDVNRVHSDVKGLSGRTLDGVEPRHRSTIWLSLLLIITIGWMNTAGAQTFEDKPANLSWLTGGANPACSNPPTPQTVQGALTCLMGSNYGQHVLCPDGNPSIILTGNMMQFNPDSWGFESISHPWGCSEPPLTTFQNFTASPTASCDGGYGLLPVDGWASHSLCRIRVVTIDQTAKPCDLCVGNPIYPGTGNKRQVEVDYAGVGESPVRVTRVYNSAVQFGGGWRINFGRSITYDYAGGTSYPTAKLNRPEGSYSFRWTGSAWVTDADVNYVLTGSTGTFIVTTPDGREKERYDSFNQLLSVEGVDGVTKYSLVYNSNYTPQRLSQIKDAFGHILQLNYDAQDRLAGFTDPAGGVVLYGYDASNRLASVTYPDGTVRQYAYNESAFTSGTNQPSLLTGIVDESTVRFANFGYTATGLANLTEHAGGVHRYTATYSTPPTFAETSTIDIPAQIKYVTRYFSPPAGAVVNDPRGAARHYSFTVINGAVRTTGGDLPCLAPCVPLQNLLTFDANGNKASVTDFNGVQTTYSFDLVRNLETSRTEAYGTPRARTITTQWHPMFRLPTQIDEPGKRTTHTYDGANGRLLTRTTTDTATALSRTWTHTYNTAGQVLTVNGPRTDVTDLTTYTYYTCTTGYQCGQVQTITNALNQTTTFNSYNAHGQPLTITNANAVVTTLTYDARQRLTSRSTSGELTAFEYWPTGLLKKATLPDLSFINYTYDAAHRLTEIRDSEGNKIVYTLDGMGNRIKEEALDPSSALSQTHTRVFNLLSQLYQDIAAANTPAVTTTFGYDGNGNQTTVNAPLSRNSTNAYDEFNRLKSSTDPQNGVTQYGYNALDQLISVTDPRNLITSYTYNALGDLKTQVSPDTGTITNTFDSGGNLKTTKDARNKTLTYTYDALNRITQAAFVDQTITYGFDTGTNGVGRLTSVSDANHSQTHNYDSKGRLISKTQIVGTVSKTQSYGYTNGNLTSITTPYGALINYVYTHGKVSGITINGASLLNNVLYEPFGPTSGWTWGNGTLAVRTFDTDGKLTQIDSAGLKTYQFDDAFRITSLTDTVTPANSWTYGYDTLDRLTSATSTAITQGFTFDADGNRFTHTGTLNTTFNYPATSNKLSSASGSLTKTYTYDASGNVTNDGTIVYTYYNNGRMKTAKNGAAAAVTYTYNAFGQRVKKTGTTRFFVYDEAGHLQGEYNSSGTMIQEFVWLGDIPVAVLTPKTGGVNIFYVHTDHLNTPRKITRPSDNRLRWTWNPDPNGKGAPNENPQALGAFAFNLRFPGQYFDSETGNHYNYFRDYDPATGRYVESDPIGLVGGLNTYSYVNGNPVAQIDPAGLQSVAGGYPMCVNGKLVGVVVAVLRAKREECGIKECMQVHEDHHVAFFNRIDPNLCKYFPENTPLRYVQPTAAFAEILATGAEIACLLKKIDENLCDAECVALLNDKIKDVQEYRAANEKIYQENNRGRPYSPYGGGASGRW